MKKLITLALPISLALCLPLGAQQLKTLSLGLGVPGQDEPQLIGLGISSDGRFACGSIEYGEGVFVMDLEAGSCSYEYISDSELRNVTDGGLAIGFGSAATTSTNIGITYSWNKETTKLEVPDSVYKYVLGEDLTNDGRVKVGSLVGYGFVTYAAYSVDGGEWMKLPMPKHEQVDRYKGESSSKAISGDGKYIIGHAGNFGPIILWTRNDEGIYEADPIFTRFCAFDESEAAEKPLAAMFPVNISNNGRYVLCRCAKYVDTEDGFQNILWFPAVYDTREKTLKQYDEPQEIDPMGLGLSGSSITDDGTFVGMVGSAAIVKCAGAFIMKADQTQAEELYDAFPEYGEVYDYCEMMGWSIPTDISADGRYILGYAYYSKDPLSEAVPSYYVTYIIDTTAGDNAVSAVGAAVGSVEIYSLDGVRLSEMKRGVNIVRSADGSVRKVLKKD